MLDLYTYGTINGQAVSIALEIIGQPYQSHTIDLTRGEQKHAAFLAINPSGRIPVIVDDVSGQPVVLSQTGAILIYLADKHQKLLSNEVPLRALTLQWMQFILTDIGTNLFNNFHLKALVRPKQPAAGEMLKQRAINFSQEIEQQLSSNQFVVGDEISVADVVAYPVINQLKALLLEGKSPNIGRWFELMSKNHAVLKGMK